MEPLGPQLPASCLQRMNALRSQVYPEKRCIAVITCPPPSKKRPTSHKSTEEDKFLKRFYQYIPRNQHIPVPATSLNRPTMPPETDSF